jgi:hypothetical protein
VTVIRLGAWCDIDDDAAQLDAAQRSASFRVREFAELDDGRRLVLTDETKGSRGFTTMTAYGPGQARLDTWADLTAESIESGVRSTVLPDEDDGEQHPWVWLATRLSELGEPTTPDQLRGVPYDVELSARVLARAQPGSRGSQAT